MKAGRRPRWVLLVVGLVGCLALAEVATRALLPAPRYRFGNDPANRLAGLIVEHPTRGYALAPDFSGTLERDGAPITIATNSLGLRDRPIDPRTGRPLLLAVGDSFTVGFGVEIQEAWPAQLEERLAAARPEDVQPRVVNAAVSGYSLRQIRLTAEELAPELQPRTVLIGLYAAGYWRLRNPYVAYRGRLVNQRAVPRLAATDDGLLYTPFDARWLRRLHLWSAEHFHFGYYLLQLPASLEARANSAGKTPLDASSSAEKLAPLIAELDRLIAYCHDRGIEPVVVLINPQSADGSFATPERLFNGVVSRSLTAAGVEVIDTLPTLDERAGSEPVMRFSDDHHWTATAHTAAAEQIAARLIAGGQLQPPAPSRPSDGGGG